MTELKNHPGLWLNPFAAASVDRLEARYGVQGIASAGRTEPEQQALINRWNAGGAYNRPPFLFKPYMPASGSRHVVHGGVAVDVADPAFWHAHGAEYGFMFNYAYDLVHFEYEQDKDKHINDAVAKPAPPRPLTIKEIMSAIGQYSIIESSKDTSDSIFVGNGVYYAIAPSWAKKLTGNDQLAPELKSTMIAQGIDYRVVDTRTYDLLNVTFATLAGKEARPRKS